MSVESNIFDALKTLVGNRVYPDYAPFETQRPFITYSQFGGQPLTFLEKALPSKKNGLFQIHVWADTRATASQLGESIEAALIQAAAFEAEPVSGMRSIYDHELPIYGASQDFSIWFNR